MISQTAINDYLNKELNDLSFVKKLSQEFLWKKITEKFPFYQWEMFPYKHQLACIYAGLDTNNLLLFLDMGAGKSQIALSLLQHKKKHHNCGKCLVLVLNPISIPNFAEQIRTHYPSATYTELTGSSVNRWKLLESTNTDFYILNYTGLRHMLTGKVTTEKGNNKQKPDIKLVSKFIKHFDAVIYDEIHSLLNHQSLQHRLCEYISQKCRFRYGLTGTPMSRSPIGLWAVFNLVDRGETLGNNFYLFRDAFFTPKETRFTIEWEFNKKLENVLHNRLANKSIRYAEEELNDLPEEVRIPVYLNLPELNRSYYKQLKEEVISNKDGVKKVENTYYRSIQITSGYLEAADEDGDKLYMVFDENPKLDALVDIIQSSAEEAKLVVFYRLIKAGDLIEESFRKEKIGFTRLYGQTKDPEKVLTKFKKDPKCKVFLVNYQSGGASLNLTEASYTVFYESPVSPIDRKQAEKRVRRGGQTKRTFMYDLIVRNTIDEKIQQYLKEGKNLFEALIEGKDSI